MKTKRHILYRITNNINGRYYIGRHSTTDIDDDYMGSGKAIHNAIAKYGIENFTKTILAEVSSSHELWLLEKQIVNDTVIKDPKSYNMAYGGKHYLDGLQTHNPEQFIQHQRQAGLIGGPASYQKKTDEEKKEWHSKGGKASMDGRNPNHPFWTGAGGKVGGKMGKGKIELWHPDATATNKNQKEYRRGDCCKAAPDSLKFIKLRQEGWRTIDEQKNKMHLIANFYLHAHTG